MNIGIYASLTDCDEEVMLDGTVDRHVKNIYCDECQKIHEFLLIETRTIKEDWEWEYLA